MLPILPLSSLTAMAVMPVLTFVSVTVAPGTIAPDASRTVPSTVAASNCANPVAGINSAATITAKRVRYTTRTLGLRDHRSPPGAADSIGQRVVDGVTAVVRIAALPPPHCFHPSQADARLARHGAFEIGRIRMLRHLLISGSLTATPEPAYSGMLTSRSLKP